MALQAVDAARPRVVLLVTSIALLLIPTLVVANRDMSLYGVRDMSEYPDGKDLAHYMSVSSSIPEDPVSPSHCFCKPLTFAQRPDLRPPILNVTQYDPAAVSPGYWFVAPYGDILPAPSRWEYQPFEVGPHIYDNAGVSHTHYNTRNNADAGRTSSGVGHPWWNTGMHSTS